MNLCRTAIVGASLALTTLCAAPAFAETSCDLNRPVMYGVNSWDSSTFQTQLSQYILEKGYGCQTDSLPGTSLPLLTGLRRGDVDIMMEVWPKNYQEAWDKGVKEGAVAIAGTAFDDCVQGWYVPRYLVEGKDAKAPDLKSVQDLVKYKDLFRDPEEPTKGRFYNGPLGWGAEHINTAKLTAYGLNPHFTNFHPGTGGALNAAIASAFKRGKPFVAYMWEPTWVMGKFDLVLLQEPAHDPKVWADLQTNKNPKKATAYAIDTAYVGVNTEFLEKAPKTMAFLKKYRVSSKVLSQAMAYRMAEKGRDINDAVVNFLKTETALWSKWVPADVAERVKNSLTK